MSPTIYTIQQFEKQLRRHHPYHVRRSARLLDKENAQELESVIVPNKKLCGPNSLRMEEEYEHYIRMMKSTWENQQLEIAAFWEDIMDL